MLSYDSHMTPDRAEARLVWEIQILSNLYLNALDSSRKRHLVFKSTQSPIEG